jgi:hypothetical protein
MDKDRLVEQPLARCPIFFANLTRRWPNLGLSRSKPSQTDLASECSFARRQSASVVGPNSYRSEEELRNEQSKHHRRT